MKSVNFEELSVEISIDKFETMDLRKEIGNTIHRTARTVPMSELARGIYYSSGPIKIEDGDYQEMIAIIRNSFAMIIQSAIASGTENVVITEQEKG